jgi:hypothetical protein
MMRSDITAAIERFLERQGITAYRDERRSKHYSVVIAHAGKATTIFFPTSSSDWRAHHRVVSKMRRKLGLTRKEVRT